MYRLGELSHERRVRMGAAALVVGTLLMVVAVIIVHYAGFPVAEFIDGEFVPLEVDVFGWIPRTPLMKGIGYLLAFAASQLMIVGAAFLWILNLPMTWARAAFAAFVAWIELVMIFGIVPSEWLNFSQTDLEWSYQDPVFDIPPLLLLGNRVTVTTGAIKDTISAVYHLLTLGGAAVFAYKLQDIGKPRPAAAEPPQATSPYGRPLVRGER